MPTSTKDTEKKKSDPALADVEPGSDADSTPVEEPAKTAPNPNKKPSDP